MTRPIAIVGAPSSLGIRPYDDGVARHLDRSPAVLRQRGLVARLHAADLGDVMPPAYRDYVRPPRRPRNEAQVMAYSRALGARVAAAMRAGQFGLVIGGDCSVALGCLVGARQAAGAGVGLVYADAHADFATPAESRTGSVASMSLALACGRGDTPLARLAGRAPLVQAQHVALLGRRDSGRAWHGDAALAASAVLDLSDHELMTRAVGDLSAAALARVGGGAGGFWIHLDADVLNPAVMCAVDRPEPGGPTPEELRAILRPLVDDPRALGLSVSVYDPALDPDRSGARQLIGLLEGLLR